MFPRYEAFTNANPWFLNSILLLIFIAIVVAALKKFFEERKESKVYKVKMKFFKKLDVIDLFSDQEKIVVLIFQDLLYSATQKDLEIIVASKPEEANETDYQKYFIIDSKIFYEALELYEDWLENTTQGCDLMSYIKKYSLLLVSDFYNTYN